MFGSPVDEEKCQRLIAELEHQIVGYVQLMLFRAMISDKALHHSYERILATQKYLGGEFVTLADLFHVPWGWVVNNELLITVFETHPNVNRWWKDISSRPAWIATLKSI